MRTVSGKQADALDRMLSQGKYRSDYRRTPKILYGGAGYGGKSYLLRTAAVEALGFFRDNGFPNQDVAIVCSDYPNLQDRHMRKIEKEFAGFGEIRKSQIHGLHVQFYGPGWEGMGRILLRNMAQSWQAGKKKGNEVSGLFPDELTEFTKEQFGELMYQLRSDANLPVLPFVAGTNPDGIGHGWVKSLFVPGYRDRSKWDKTVQASWEDYYFIQALKTDNPNYDANKDAVDLAINALENPEIRRARDAGSWDIYLGGRFPQFSRSVHCFTWPEFLGHYGLPSEGHENDRLFIQEIARNPEKYGFSIYGCFDYGTSTESMSVFLLFMVGRDGHIWMFSELSMVAMQLPRQAAEIRGKLGRYPTRINYCDPALNGKAPESKSGLSRLTEFRKEGVHFLPAINDRVEGWATLDHLLYFDVAPGGAVIRAPKLHIHAHECPNLVEFFEEAPRSKTDPEDVDTDYDNDHAGDAARYGLHTRFARPAKRTAGPLKGTVQHEIERIKSARAEARREKLGDMPPCQM